MCCNIKVNETKLVLMTDERKIAKLRICEREKKYEIE